MKRIYKLHPSGKGLVDITDRVNRTPESVAPAVWGDIEPYEFMGESPTGKSFEVVGSRSRHREILKEGGYIEVGNERPKNLTQRERD